MISMHVGVQTILQGQAEIGEQLKIFMSCIVVSFFYAQSHLEVDKPRLGYPYDLSRPRDS